MGACPAARAVEPSATADLRTTASAGHSRERSSPRGTACTVPVRFGVSYAMSTPTITMRETLDAADDSGVAKVSKLL